MRYFAIMCLAARKVLSRIWWYALRAELCVALDTALAGWDTIIDLLPETWVYRDVLDDESLTRPTLDARFQLLQRFHHDDFWRMT